MSAAKVGRAGKRPGPGQIGHGKPSNGTRALIVGVDRFANRAIDKLFCLRGSRENAILLARYCVDVLRVDPSEIRVLTSPPLTAAELLPQDAGASFGALAEATSAEVDAGLSWLLAAAAVDTRLFAFSGHGAWSTKLGGPGPGQEEGPVLCLADLDHPRQPTRGALGLATLKRRVDTAKLRDHVVALFDTCHVDRRPYKRTASVEPVGLFDPSAPALDVAALADSYEVSSRVLVAAKPGEPAFQVRTATGGSGGRGTGDLWHGAFTHALLAAASRWGASWGVAHASYADVLERANALTAAAGVPQVARWLGSPSAAGSPFLASVTWPTVKAPDAAVMRAQVEPNTKLDGAYRLYSWRRRLLPGVDVEVAQTLVPAEEKTYSGYTYEVGTEYWRMLDAAVPNYVEWRDVALVSGDWPAGVGDPLDGTRTFTSPVEPEWNDEGTGALEDYLRVGCSDLYVKWDMQVTGSTWSGSIAWASLPRAYPNFAEPTDTGDDTLRFYQLFPAGDPVPDDAGPGRDVWWGYVAGP